MKHTQAKVKGFTLIELIVVIVILGIMAAVAGPKFVDLQSDARVSVLQGVEASVRSAMTLAHSKSLILGTESNTTSTIVVEGTTIDMAFGYPNLVGIGNMVDLTGASDITYVSPEFRYTAKTACQITYTAATNATTPASVTSAKAVAASC